MCAWPSGARATVILGFCVLFTAAVGATTLGKNEPDPNLSTAVSAAGVQVSAVAIPSPEGGSRLDACYLFGGTLTDATITITLVDAIGEPVAGYAASDIWLETTLGGLMLCEGGAVADADTDENGVTTFSGPVSGGGHSDPEAGELTRVVVGGQPLIGSDLDIQFNSPDIDGDLLVGAQDIIQFKRHFLGEYDYAADYFFDGILNNADIVLLSQGWASGCAEWPEAVPDPALVGVYFDAGSCYANCATSIAGTLLPTYLVLTNTNQSVIQGFEVGVELSGPVSVENITIYGPDAINGTIGGSETHFAVGYSAPYPVVDSTVLLASWDSHIWVEGPAEYNIVLPEASSIPHDPVPLYFGDDTDIHRQLNASSGDYLLPVASVNGPCVGLPDTLVVDVAPNVLSAPWHLSGPAGFEVDGFGDQSFTGLPTGSYTVMWQDVAEWLTPSPAEQTQCLSAGVKTTFSAAYVRFSALITSIADVGNDQGRQVRILWNRSLFDAPDDGVPITGYGVYRRQDAYKLALDSTAGRSSGQPERDVDRLEGWDFLATLPAHGEEVYQYVAPTLCDSTANGGICWSFFMIRAMTPDPFEFYDSPPDSGYSVDNLAPAVPTGLAVAYAFDGNSLAWEESAEADFQHFRIYRGLRPDCQPDAQQPIALITGTGWTDDLHGAAHSAWDYCYWITAVDFAGNESVPSLWSDAVLTGAAEESQQRPATLHQNVPNPFNPGTRISYDLPRSEQVTISVFDMAGRLVQMLVSAKTFPAGRHEIAWNGRDQMGRMAAAGVYFCRMEAGAYQSTIRMLLIK